MPSPDLTPKFQLVSEHLAAGRFEPARQVLLRALQQAPSSPEANNGMAVVLTHLGQVEQALFYAERAAALAPSDGNILNTLGSTLNTLGKSREAVAVLERAAAADPADGNTRLTLSNALWSAERYAESVAILREVVAKSPDDPEALYRLGPKEALLLRGPAAYRACRAARAKHPGHLELAKATATVAQYVDGLSPAEVAREHRELGALLNAMGLRPVKRDWPNTRDPDRKLRVGFVSPDLRAHSVSYFLEPLMRNLDRNQFHITCYSSFGGGDEVTKRLKGLASAWVAVAGTDDLTLVNRIITERTDIMIDLAGHSVGSRLLALGHRAAPVQATYCGYAWTSGVPNIDYRFVDSLTDPPSADGMATEALVRIDPCFLAYRPFDQAPEPARGPRQVGGGIVFASFNVTAKMNDRVIALWARVMHATAGSRLLLKSLYLSDPTLRSDLIGRCAVHGIGADRLVLHAAKASIADHLAMYNEVDVCLDPFPYAGTTTTCEALWMGVPVVTLAGEAHAGRVGVSLLTNAGLPELIAPNEDAYVAITSALAADTARLDDLRRTLRDRLRSSALMDAPAHAARFGAALRECWRRWCANP